MMFGSLRVLMVTAFIGGSLASQAHAFPSVGSVAHYASLAYQISDNKLLAEGTYEQTLVSQDVFGKSFELKTTYTSALLEAPATSVRAVAASDLSDDAQLALIVKYCNLYDGTKETVTVKAGTFDTCKTTFENDTEKSVTWYGKVPFGLVKSETIRKDAGQRFTLELTEAK